ncbi:MAG: hypothetical protein AB1551_05070 [Actinomycetota bacterium]
MQQGDPQTSFEGSRRARRRGFFSRSGDAPSDALSHDDPTEAVVATYQRIVEERLEEGLHAIQQTAYALMHEIAGEVWRTAGGNKEEVRAKILEGISRDQAIRSLIAHSDERFQDLAVRTARLEDEISALSEQTRAAKDALAGGIETLSEAAGSVALHGLEEVRQQLDEVGRQVAAAFQAIAERDRAIVETIDSRVREHGELVAQETEHVAQAMQTYVQQGVSALGQLASTVQSQVESLGVRDVDVSGRMGKTIEEQMQLLGEQLAAHGDQSQGQMRSIAENIQFLHDRLSVESKETKDALEALEARAQRVPPLDGPAQVHTQREREAAREVAVQVSKEMVRTVESRVLGLARLVRSDSEALRHALVQTAAERDEAMARALDERLGRVSEALTDATRSTVAEMTRRLREEIERAIGVAITERFDDTIDRLNVASSVMQRATENAERMQQTTEDKLLEALDTRVTSLARMIRSDNQALAERLQDLDAGKQTLRAVKEMQASLPAEIVEIVDRRLEGIADQLHRDVQATAESVARVSDMLERKVEEATTRMGKRYDNDIQDVVDRMGDAMHALASLGRQRSPDRIDLE